MSASRAASERTVGRCSSRAAAPIDACAAASTVLAELFRPLPAAVVVVVVGRSR